MKTHLVKSLRSLLEYLLKTKIRIQLVSRGRLSKKPCLLKRYVSLGRISPFCPA